MPRDKDAKPGAPHETRREQLHRSLGLEDGDLLEMPPCEGPLVSYLFEIGPSIHDGPITHQEVGAWMDNSGIRLTSWEARMLRRLSGEYLIASAQATDIEAPAPWQEASYAKRAETIRAERARDALRALASL